MVSIESVSGLGSFDRRVSGTETETRSHYTAGQHTNLNSAPTLQSFPSSPRLS